MSLRARIKELDEKIKKLREVINEENNWCKQTKRLA